MAISKTMWTSTVARLMRWCKRNRREAALPDAIHYGCANGYTFQDSTECEGCAAAVRAERGGGLKGAIFTWHP